MAACLASVSALLISLLAAVNEKQSINKTVLHIYNVISLKQPGLLTKSSAIETSLFFFKSFQRILFKAALMI